MKKEFEKIKETFKNRISRLKKINWHELKEKVVKEFDSKSLKFKLWFYFVLFSVIILLILWLLQIVFLNTYYQAMKKNEVVRTANEIIESYGTNHFQDTIDEYAYKDSMNISILDREGNSLYVSNISNIRPVRPSVISYEELIYNVDNSKNKEVMFKTDNSRLNIPMLIYGKLWNDNYYVYITSPLEPLTSTTYILGNQLVYVTIVVLIIGFVISMFLSKKLSRPIIDIKNKANELALGNYDIVFEQSGYSEIDGLATTLNYTTRELSRTNNLRKELIANVSHDLRTPLTMIKSYAEMVRDISFKDKKKSKQHLNVIIEETDRLSLLVNDIMNLSKLEAKIDELKITRFNLSDVVKNIIGRFEYLVEKDKYIIDIFADDNLYIKADKEKLEQVIYNLVSNAINYTGKDKKIIINLKLINDKIRFEVIDSGAGISKANIDNIWDRYYKVNNEHKRSVIGTGLGLAIVKDILVRHNAKYGVISKIGKGSTFYFELNNDDIK